MVEKTTASRKTPIKKAVIQKKSTAKKITLKKFDEEKPVIKKSPVTPPKSTVKKQTKRTVSKPPENSKAIKPEKDQLQNESENHVQQLRSIVDELSLSLQQYAEQGNDREERNLQVIKALTDTIKADHEKMQPVSQQTDKQQNENIKQIIKRNRLIIIPTAIISVVALMSTIYVANILATTMSTISTDIHKIQQSLNDISTRVDSMSLDTSSMSGNIQQLSHNMNSMSKDISVLSHNIAPNMRSMRNGMPWAPSP